MTQPAFLFLGKSGGASPPSDKFVVVSGSGNDVTGVRGRADRPFRSVEAARDAALAGDMNVVYPGSYICTSPLSKHLVNWLFMPGAGVSRSGDASMHSGIWDDGGAAMTFSVFGAGDFTQIGVGANGGQFALVNASHPSSVIHVEARDITATADEDCIQSAVVGSAGQCYVRARTITADGVSTSGYAVWWLNGRCHVRAERMTGTSNVVVADCSGVPTGDFFVRTDEIAGLLPILSQGTNAAAAAWIEALTIKNDSDGSLIKHSVMHAGAGRLYVHAQKLFGGIAPSGDGLTYIRADKVSAIANGSAGAASLFHQSGNGTSRIEVDHWDPVATTGETIKQTAGTLYVVDGDLITGAGAKGVEITGGTMRLRGPLINTAANNATNPITKSGGTLVLHGDTVLVAEATRDSIAAGTAQNVKSYGAWANKAKHANVTIQGTLNVDANVS